MNKQHSLLVTGVLAVVAILCALSTFGINDNGYRTVVQLPSGKTFIKSEPGIYFDWFGTSTEYPDLITFDFEANSEDSNAPQGVPVRYQDGGTGAVFGVARFTLPTDHEGMLALHKAFRSEKGIRDKMITPVIKESLNLTAGLMTSEEVYAEKRNEYLAWSADQVGGGKYITVLVSRTQIVEPEELDANDQIVKRAVTRVQNIPMIKMVDDVPLRGDSPFVDYGVIVSGFQLTDWTFEPRTLEQIQEKRAANMAIITSQANAAKANQQRLQAIAEGEKDVATAQYAEEVLKAKAIVVAERQAEVAKINASQQVEVNRQNYLAQVQDVLAAEQEALAIDARTTAEAAAKKRIIEADGALTQKIAAIVEINANYAREFGKQKWVPEVTMGASGEGGSGANAATEMIDLLTFKTAQDLALDLKVGS
jgi:hypothetical protein